MKSIIINKDSVLIDITQYPIPRSVLTLGKSSPDHIVFDQDALPVLLFKLPEIRTMYCEVLSLDESHLDLESKIEALPAKYMEIANQEFTEEELEIVSIQKRQIEAVKNNCSDTIVEARGSWASLVSGVTVVITADGTNHFVSDESYQKQHRDPLSRYHLSLAKCTTIQVKSFTERLENHFKRILSNAINANLNFSLLDIERLWVGVADELTLTMPVDDINDVKPTFKSIAMDLININREELTN